MELGKRIPQVHDLNFDSVYHYQAYNEQFLSKFLSEQFIFCSDPRTFNDPWDCKPYYDTGNLSDPEEIAKYRSFIFEQYKKNPAFNPNDSELHNIVLNSLCGDSLLLEKTLNSLSRSAADTHANSFRIYCLTPCPQNILMWSHYANNHRGVCLEFDTKNALFGGAWEVQYSQYFPKFQFLDVHESDPMLALLHKSIVWKYEQEFRVVAHTQNGKAEYGDSHLCIKNNNFLRIPDNSLKSIIVGCQADYDEICTLVNKIAPNLPVRKAIRASSQYSLEIE